MSDQVEWALDEASGKSARDGRPIDDVSFDCLNARCISTRDAVQHPQQIVAMRPATEATGDVDMAGMPKIDEAAAPSGGDMPQAIEGHIGVVEAAYDKAGERQRQVGHRPEIDDARMQAIGWPKIAGRDKQCAAHLPCQGAARQIGDKNRTEAMSHQIDGPVPEDFAFESVAPMIKPWPVPVDLFDENCIRMIPQPMALPVSLVRPEQSRNDERFCHDINLLRR